MPDDTLPPQPTSKELSDVGVRLNAASDPDTRAYDPLERYRSIPNHSMFLFTSEDTVVDRYLRVHWGALDGMSGDVCDIHVPLLQLRGEADAYSQLKDLKGILGLSSLRPSDLPALHIWSSQASVRIPLKPYRTEESVRDVLRLVFSRLADLNGPLLPQDAIELVRSVEQGGNAAPGAGQLIAHAIVGGNIIQITHNHNYDKGVAMPEPESGKSKQEMRGVESTGDVTQSSDAAGAEQSIERLKAARVNQTVSGKDRLSIGSYSAYGKWAIVGLVVVVIAVVVLNIILS